VLRLSLLIGAALMLAVGRTHAAAGMALVGAGALALRAARPPARLELAFVTLLCADSLATALGAFAHVNRQDRPGHLVLTALATPMLFHLARRGGVMKAAPADGAASRLAFWLVVAGLGLALGAAWELVEYGSDAILATNMSLGYGDTMGDLVADAAGASVAAALLTWYLTRRPGESGQLGRQLGLRSRRAAAAQQRDEAGRDDGRDDGVADQPGEADARQSERTGKHQRERHDDREHGRLGSQDRASAALQAGGRDVQDNDRAGDAR
jgi:hypothetical protein